ncbi:MAG: LuxR C-terminal-related transcriptional regulator [Desulfarculales bacterium]|jgi:LuxR family maltose regulon positive regulatory protein|nr:LuxR C-terminal-related transcriptional regulator [Desulfarculales bacterium]
MTMNQSRRSPERAPFYFSERLASGLAVLLQTPLTIVQAPVGYGKTTAVREFLDARAIRRLWVPVLAFPSGVSENAFWRDFCRALAACPEAAEAASSLAHLGFPGDSARFETARELMHQLSFTLPTVLVVDDFHLLPSPDFGALCEILAQDTQAGKGIPNFHTALVTRHAYAGKKERLRLSGACAVVAQESFLFTVEDIEGYCALRGLNISREQIRALHTATGGWISGLNIHLRHYREHGSLLLPAPAKGEMAVSSEADLPPESALILEEEIYAPLSEESKNLLFALCPLERFTVLQADFLYQNDTRKLLGELVRQNSFILFDAGSGVYSLHSIFRHFLTLLFQALPRRRQRELHAAIGDWFAQEGEFVAAMEQYFEARDFEKALTVMEQDMARNLVTENAAFFTRMFRDCPEEILNRHPAAGFKYALAALSACDFPAFAGQCARLVRQCAAMAESDPQTRIWRGELEILLALTKYNDIAAMSVHHRRGYELLGRPTALYPPESTWTMGCPSVLFMFHRQSGKLRENLRLLQNCLPLYYQAAAHHGAGGEYLFEAEALYQAGEFAAAALVCREAEVTAGRHNQLCNIICAMFLRLRLAFVAGEFAQAQALAVSMRGLIKKRRDYFLLHTVDLCEGWLYGALGSPGKIPLWLREDTDTRLYAFAKGIYYLVHGRSLLLAGRYAQIPGLLGNLLKEASYAKHRLFFIHAHIYIAAAYHGLGEGRQAGTALRTALDAALPDKLFMPFVECGDDILPLLRALKRGRRRLDIQRILELASDWKTRLQSLPQALSAAERELLHLAGQGQSLKEIAARRLLSHGRVKNIFAGLYKRFRVHGRAELLARLAEEGLI